ncbi:MAG TPA: malate synthase A, partial [Thermoanaerobaculia bacterium]
MVAFTQQKIRVEGSAGERFDEVLTPEALEFLADLHHHFAEARRGLLDRRNERQRDFEGGELPTFLDETAAARESEWRVPAPPPDLLDRRVEITGPVDRKMVINALNSGAKVFMADFEDANSPTWENCVAGQVNLIDAVRRRIEITGGEKEYRLNRQVATLVVRPRGWHLDE